MKKIIASICLLVGVLSMQAQSGTGTSFDVPELFPVSPTAASLYKHSKIPMNLTSGQANLLIPIFTIKQYGFTLPISLRYNYGGMVLEEGPSNIGLGWTLAAAGVINREVRGLPDENSNGYHGINSIRNSVLEPYFTNNTSISVDYLKAISNGLYDTEPDIYHVSMGGMSFSFKVGENNQAYLLSKHNHKVDFSLNEIIITDDNGIKYYFSTKETSSSLGEFDDVNGNFGNGHSYTSSWFITKIKLLNGSEIRFGYIGRDEVLNYSFMATAYINHQFTPTNPYSTSCDGKNWGGTQTYSKTFRKEKLLTRIYFDQGSVEFDWENKGFYKLYKGISIKNKENKSIVNYDFIYDDNVNRDLLMTIERNKKHFYEFNYHNTNLVPDFVTSTPTIPTAMDWWGYYNGKHSNVAITAVPGTPQSPDKYPSLQHTIAGALEKVTYPTGGTSTFSYEENEILKKNDNNNIATNQIPEFNRRLLLKMNGEPNQTKEKTFSYTFMEDTYAEISHDIKTYLGAYVELHMDAPGPAPRGNYVNQTAYLREQERLFPDFQVTDKPFYASYYIEDIGDGQDNARDLTWIKGSTNGVIKIKAGTYNFRLKTSGVSAYGNSSIQLKIKFYRSSNTNSQEQEQYVDIGGIRVKEIKSCPNNTEIEGCITRSFEYNDAVTFNQGTYYYDTKVRLWCKTGNARTIYNLDRRIYNYKSFTNVNFNGGVPVYYRKVKEGIGKELVAAIVNNNYDYINDFSSDKNEDGTPIVALPNGKIPKPTSTVFFPHYKDGYEYSTFDSPVFDSYLTYPFVPKTKDLSMGRIKKYEILKYDTSSEAAAPNYEVIKENGTTYTQFRDDLIGSGFSAEEGYPLGLKVARKISFIGGEDPIYQRDIDEYFYFITYGEVHNRFLPSEQTEKEYMGLNNFTTQNSTSYNSLLLPKSTKTIDSKGSARKTEQVYLTELINPTPDEQLLITQNNIATPIQVKNYFQIPNQEEVLLGTQKTKYKNFGNDLVLQNTIKSAKGNNALESRLVYHIYNSKGNPLEASKEDGIHTIYLWGYNDQYPITKIENATFTEVATALGITQEVLKTYDETKLIQINGLRNSLPNAMVSTYTYEPLIGMSSVTDPRGYTMTYHYDEFNQLEYVKDADGNLVSENKYNYKN